MEVKIKYVEDTYSLKFNLMTLFSKLMITILIDHNCYRQRSIDILLHCEKKKLDLLTQLSDTLLRLSTCPSISLFFAVAG